MVALATTGLLGIAAPSTAAGTPQGVTVSAAAAVASGFTLKATPAAVSMVGGTSKVIRITVKRAKGFKSPLAFTVTNAMSGVAARTGKVSSRGTTLVLQADTTVKAQSGQVQVTATGGGLSQSVTISVQTAGGAAPATAPPAPAATVAAPPKTQAPAPTPAPTVATVPPTIAVTVPPTAPTTIAQTTTTKPAVPVKISLAANWLLQRAAQGGTQILSVDVSSDAPDQPIAVRLIDLPPGINGTERAVSDKKKREFLISFDSTLADGDYTVNVEAVAGKSVLVAKSAPIPVNGRPIITCTKLAIDVVQGTDASVECKYTVLSGVVTPTLTIAGTVGSNAASPQAQVGQLAADGKFFVGIYTKAPGSPNVTDIGKQNIYVKGTSAGKETIIQIVVNVLAKV
jgi:hypothetical protein